MHSSVLIQSGVSGSCQVLASKTGNVNIKHGRSLFSGLKEGMRSPLSFPGSIHVQLLMCLVQEAKASRLMPSTERFGIAGVFQCRGVNLFHFCCFDSFDS